MGKFTIEKDIAQHIKRTVCLVLRVNVSTSSLTLSSSTTAKDRRGTALSDATLEATLLMVRRGPRAIHIFAMLIV